MNEALGFIPSTQGKKEKKKGCAGKDGVRSNSEEHAMAWGECQGAAETKAGQGPKLGTIVDRGMEFLMEEARGSRGPSTRSRVKWKDLTTRWSL